MSTPAPTPPNAADGEGAGGEAPVEAEHKRSLAVGQTLDLRSASARADGPVSGRHEPVPAPQGETPAMGSDAVVNSDDPMVGQLVAGRYRLLERVGEGGMGAVYRGEHTTLRKPVAVKFLHAEMSRHTDVVARFEREAFAAAQLEHPNVVAAHDFGRTDDGQFFLVMEFVSGPNLRDVIDRDGALPPKRALHIARHVASALGKAHGKGIVHRDLKPDNVVLVATEDDPDFAKVIDFGIAKVTAGDVPGGQGVTKAGMVFGTPHYMAPEQALGAAVDHRADLYAFAVLCFELLTGRLPYETDDVVQVMSQHLTAPVPRVSDHAKPGTLPHATDAVFEKALAKRASERYESAADFVRALGEALGTPIHGRVTVVGQQTPVQSGAGAVAPEPIAQSNPHRTIPAGGAVPLTLNGLQALVREDPKRAARLAAMGAGVLLLTLVTLVLSVRGVSHPSRAGNGTASVTPERSLSPTNVTARPSASASATNATVLPLPTATATAPTDPHERLRLFRARPDVAVMVDAARGRNAARAREALEQIRAQAAPDDASPAFVLGGVYARARGQSELSAQRYAEALDRAPGLVDQEAMLDHLVRAAVSANTPPPTALRLLQGPLVSRAGPALAELASSSSGATRTRALALLNTPAFAPYFDDTSRDLIALNQARTCPEKVAVIERLGAHGDERALARLRGIRVGTGCGFLGLGRCNACLDPAVPNAIRAIQSRLPSAPGA